MANDQGKSGQQGGTPQHNPDQVSNDPNKAWEEGRQGGQMPDDKWENDPQRSGVVHSKERPAAMALVAAPTPMLRKVWIPTHNSMTKKTAA